jgi:hypothetical protein
MARPLPPADWAGAAMSLNDIWLIWALLALALDAGVWLGERRR